MTTATQTRVLTTKKGRSVETTLSDAEAISLLSKVESDFAQDLYRRSSKGLSHDQMVWVHILVLEAKAKLTTLASVAQQPTIKISNTHQDVTEILQYTKILELFDKAKQHVKYPKIRLSIDNIDLVLSVAGANSKHPGTINVTDDGSYGSTSWYGRIDRHGNFNKSSCCSGPIVRVLKRFAANPTAIAHEHGHTTGYCCFCARNLTDERSVSVGYGPVCADRYGLPWGN